MTLCLVRAEDRLLLLRASDRKDRFAGLWNGIGGHVRAGENIRDAARREVREESGLEPNELRLRAVIHEEGLLGKAHVLFVFTARLEASRETAQPRATREGPGPNCGTGFGRHGIAAKPGRLHRCGYPGKSAAADEDSPAFGPIVPHVPPAQRVMRRRFCGCRGKKRPADREYTIFCPLFYTSHFNAGIPRRTECVRTVLDWPSPRLDRHRVWCDAG